MKLAINIKPEYVVSMLGLNLTNTLVTSLLVTIILSVLGVVFSRELHNRKSLLTRGLVVLLGTWLSRVDAVTHSRTLSKRVFPLTATMFLFICTSNILALLPGFLGSLYVASQSGKIPLLRSPNTDLSTTVALAILSVGASQYFSIKELGAAKFFERFINIHNVFASIIGFFELISEATRIVSFSFRLFGNMFAGEVLLLICSFIMPYFIPLPFMIMELFIGCIQAFIFATLTLSFIEMGMHGGSSSIRKEVSA